VESSLAERVCCIRFVQLERTEPETRGWLQVAVTSKSINVNRQIQAGHYREIFGIALPVGLEALFQASFSLTDQIIVGSLGASAVAAVGLSNNLSFILTLLYAAIGTGSGAFIAQAYGRRDMDEVSKIAAVGQTSAAVLGICSSLPLILFPSPILRYLSRAVFLARSVRFDCRGTVFSR